jgi:glycosyltransferase involved in cell wall biosynthesis
MRIAMIAPLELRVPPIAYGGTELVVSLLTEELVRRGHDVTLFASGDSETNAHLVPGCETYLRGSGRDSQVLSLLNVLACIERADEFDIIHNHTCPEGMALAGVSKTPMLTTLHGGMAGESLLLFERYKGWYATVSRSAKRLLPDKERFGGVVYNGIDCETYPFNAGPRDDTLLYLSRISREKGTHLAIEVAKRLGRRLIIAGNVHEVDAEYFRQEVEPHIDGRLIFYAGEAGYTMKRELLSRTSCLLAPVTWDEPFGLFMAEAMVCGTPVIALRRGSIPEVVIHGQTGFVVDSVEEMTDMVASVGDIDPYVCRREVEQRFSAARMTTDYLAAYERVIAESCSATTGLVRPSGPNGASRAPQAVT